MFREKRNILGWLGLKQEQMVMEDAMQHVDATYNTVISFQEAMKAYFNNDITARNAAIAKVHRYEHLADELRVKMVSELSEGMLLPPDREDMMHFVKSLDRIADWTNGASRLLGFLDETLPGDINKNFEMATQIIVGSISRLKDAIESLMKNELEKALKDCNDVEKFETEADDQKERSIAAIIHSKLDAAKLLLAYQLAEYMEGITDKVEDAADFVKVLAVRSK